MIIPGDPFGYRILHGLSKKVEIDAVANAGFCWPSHYPEGNARGGRAWGD
jgi:hypothetical protein